MTDLIIKVKFLLTQTNYNIFTSKEIIKLIPNLKDWVDLVLETNDCILCFKDLWTNDNLTINILNNYLYGSEQMNSSLNTNKKYIIILLVKNFTINFSNEIFNKNNIYIIKNINQEKLINELNRILYSNNIYFYEEDGSTIMLDD